MRGSVLAAAWLAGMWSLLAGSSLALELLDPTRPPVARFSEAPGETASVLAPLGPSRLSAIVFSPEETFAVVNGRRIQVGDTVDGARVVRIEPYAVHLAPNVELRFSRGSIKTPVEERDPAEEGKR